MALQKAIVITDANQASLVRDRPRPALRDDYILVKTAAVALNPTDWKHIDNNLSTPGALVGCDYAGVVVEVGKAVKKPFRAGDRICGFVHGSNAVQHEDGAFADYIVAKGDLQMRVPEGMGFEEAATLGLGVTTAAQGLYQGLKLRLPTESGGQSEETILIYGGSTATGTLAIQFAKMSGYRVLTTCSAANFDLVKSRGADEIFDYRNPGSAAAIREATKNGLKLIFDTVSSGSSTGYCEQAMSTAGGAYSALLPVGIDRANIESRATMAYTAFGEDFTFGPRAIGAKPEDREFAERIAGIVEKTLAEGKLQVHPPELCSGGLEGVLDGLQRMREGKVSGTKLVYKI
ncbi:chaperonin 10-like protein [Aspergillus pseudoustus]|uniref:Chaperonin 10-like protein n=1 Tax=Aspergillus pseudoustus TaxID=1810923 RepID=A0ABR4JQ87_9EURO